MFTPTLDFYDRLQDEYGTEIGFHHWYDIIFPVHDLFGSDGSTQAPTKALVSKHPKTSSSPAIIMLS